MLAKILVILCLFFLFLPSCYLPLGLRVPVYLIVCLFSALIFILLLRNKIINFIQLLINKTPTKYFILFCLWIIVDMICLLCMGKISLIRGISALIIILGGYFLVYYFVPAYITAKFFSFKQWYKIIILVLFIILIWGVIAHIGVVYGILPIQSIQSLLSNKQLIDTGNVYSLEKARSVFFEAGFFGYFICINLPMIFSTRNSNFKIFNNKYINFLIKKTILPLAFICIYITHSPITYVFALIITFVSYCYKLYKQTSFKNLVIKLCTLFLIIIGGIELIYPIIKQQGPIKRIQIVISSMTDKNINLILNLEQSLGTRIISYTNSFCLFLKHPILGVGLDHGKYVMHKQMEFSPLILTPELKILQSNAYRTGKMIFNQNILCWVLSELGIFGFFFLYLFLFKSLYFLNKSKKYFKGIELEFVSNIRNTLFMLICLSFYEVSLVQAQYHFFIFALVNVIILQAQIKQKELNSLNNRGMNYA